VHTFLYLFTEVFRVVTGNSDIDAVNELCLRLRILRDGLAFLYEVQFDIKILDGEPVAQIAIQTVCFLDEQNTAGSVALVPWFASLANVFRSSVFEIPNSGQPTPRARLSEVLLTP
jgi:hypothetical protein